MAVDAPVLAVERRTCNRLTLVGRDEGRLGAGYGRKTGPNVGDEVGHLSVGGSEQAGAASFRLTRDSALLEHRIPDALGNVAQIVAGTRRAGGRAPASRRPRAGRPQRPGPTSRAGRCARAGSGSWRHGRGLGRGAMLVLSERRERLGEMRHPSASSAAISAIAPSGAVCITSASRTAFFALFSTRSSPRESSKMSSGSSGVVNAVVSAARSSRLQSSARCSQSRSRSTAAGVAVRPGNERLHPLHRDRDLLARACQERPVSPAGTNGAVVSSERSPNEERNRSQRRRGRERQQPGEGDRRGRPSSGRAANAAALRRCRPPTTRRRGWSTPARRRKRQAG